MKTSFVGFKSAEMDKAEVKNYEDRALEKYGDALEELEIEVLDDDEVKLTYHLADKPFERIRRITGYLIGTLDRWNNAKRSEEKDRVKHQ